MPLELKLQRDGRLRNTWYGRYEINGRKIFVNLGVKIAGTPPEKLSVREEGDTAFERSRATAQAKLDSIVEETRTKQGAVRWVKKLYEIETGEAIKSVKLGDLADEWAKIERRREPNARYASQCQSTLNRFAAFVRLENPKVLEIAQITRTMARAFMDAEAKRGVTGKTWNDTLKLLRATFRYLLPAGGINPFADTPTRETETVFRQPFTPEELGAINEAAKADEFIRPIIIVGICTAMRRGDCCLLEWKDVDLGKRFITVKTSKTGQTVSIPIFPMLQDELLAWSKEQGAKRKAISTPHPDPLPGRRGEGMKRDGYVFPEQARMYLENPDGITWRVKKILAVGLGQENAECGMRNAETVLPEISTDEARKRGEDFIAKLPEGEKRSRMAAVFKLYMDGNNIAAVMAGANVSKGSVSGYLNEIEAAIGCRIIRGASRTGHQAESGKRKAEITGLQVARKHGLRRASVRDFHSFRVTWVTLALTAGVPLELVQKVTGHKTTDIVLKHYFQPGREAFRSALNAAMPALLTNGQKPEVGAQRSEDGGPKTIEVGVQKSEVGKRDKKVRAILERSTAKTWKQDQARMLKLLA
jgi:integrase